jgi:parallel beta-helix repeat protein
LVEGNRITGNNERHFSRYWEAGGFKCVATNNSTWRDNRLSQNQGTAMWYDIDNDTTTVVRNTCNDNAGMGIHYEISARATIASNVVFRNGDMGIEIANSGGNIYLYNNTLAGNRRAVHIKDDNRGTSSNPAIPYVVQFVECRNNLFSSDREEPFGAHDYRRIQTAEQMGVSADYDGYYRPSTSKVPNLAAWSRGSADQYFPRLVDFQNGTGQERHGLSIDNQAANPFFVDEPGGNFTLLAGSPAKGAGVALPQAIATAIGVGAGTPVDLGALRW